MATLVCTDNYMALYLDGEFQDEQSGTIDLLDMYSNQIGYVYTEGWLRGNNSWFFYRGKLDDIKIYSKRLTETEVKILYYD